MADAAPGRPRAPRLFTLDEANEIVPELVGILPRVRDALHRYRYAREQIADLEAMWAPPGRVGLDDRENPDHADYARLLQEAGRAEKEARVLLGALQGLGVEMKDPTLGLVDFPTERDGEVVYLCWKEGERRIEAWHDLQSGFAGRRPIHEF